MYQVVFPMAASSSLFWTQKIWKSLSSPELKMSFPRNWRDGETNKKRSKNMGFILNRRFEKEMKRNHRSTVFYIEIWQEIAHRGEVGYNTGPSM